MTAAKTRGRTVAGLSGVLLAAASVGIAAADHASRPTPHAAGTQLSRQHVGAAEGEIEKTVHCGLERWDVKTGSDPDATKVDLGTAVPTTISKLNAIAAPKSPHTRVQPVETTVYVVHATLTSFKREDDSDYHLALADRNGNEMIAEIPFPKCVHGGPFKPAITKVRNTFDTRYHATSGYQDVNVKVTISGVGFFDKIHNQRGVATNGIELHPLVALRFSSH
ncbi:MAG: hypothetical protein ACXVJ7_02160 [Acidimicrobiia bacterium]